MQQWSENTARRLPSRTAWPFVPPSVDAVDEGSSGCDCREVWVAWTGDEG